MVARTEENESKEVNRRSIISTVVAAINNIFQLKLIILFVNAATL